MEAGDRILHWLCGGDCHFSQELVYHSVGLKMPPASSFPLLSAKGIFAAFLGRFSRASPLRTLLGLRGW